MSDYLAIVPLQTPLDEDGARQLAPITRVS
jgi:hypothetical protein